MGRRGRRRENEERNKEMVRLFKSGNTLQTIGDIYGISRERVRQLISRENVTKEEGGLIKKLEINLSVLKSLINNGFSLEEISYELGLGTQRIRQIAKENGLSITTELRMKFNAIYPKIKKLHDAGYKQTEIAEILGISQNLVSKVLVNQYGIRKRKTKNPLLQTTDVKQNISSTSISHFETF